MSYIHKMHFSNTPSLSTSTHLKCQSCLSCIFAFSFGLKFLEDKHQLTIYPVIASTDVTPVASTVYIL